MKVDAVKQMQGITIKVKFCRSRELRVRIWIAEQILRLAARVLNCDIKLVESECA